MKGRKGYLVVILLQVVVLVSATSRPFAPYGDAYGTHQSGQNPHSSQATLSSKEGLKTTEGGVEEEQSASYIGMSKIGSSPPSCLHKCYGCSPCEAIQVPTTSSHVGLQYANYEPEGWKCKCGPSFYSP